MTAEIKGFTGDSFPTRSQPKKIFRPCDYGLVIAVNGLETQVGTVEAYNRLCDAALMLKNKIDSGNSEKPHEIWLTDPEWIYPMGQKP